MVVLALSLPRVRASAMALAAGLALSSMTAAAGAASPRWRSCGSVKQAPHNGYVSTNRVEARDQVSCAVARHIGLHFGSGGYTYRGMICFYAPMGSGDPGRTWPAIPRAVDPKRGTDRLPRRGGRPLPGRRQTVSPPSGREQFAADGVTGTIPDQADECGSTFDPGQTGSRPALARRCR